jgi:nitrite reductase/ring-hydroxylating ferredoxin subunit
MLRLCPLADIPDNDARGFRSSLGEVIVVRQGVAVYGYLNRCPHIGIGLNFQPDVFMDLTQRYLLCANHGALFRVEDGFVCAARVMDNRSNKYHYSSKTALYGS